MSLNEFSKFFINWTYSQYFSKFNRRNIAEFLDTCEEIYDQQHLICLFYAKIFRVNA